MDIDQDIVFMDYSKTLLKKWWLIVIFALIGGMAGFIFTIKNPPIYEAFSVLIVGNDYTSVDRTIWTDTKSDTVINRSALIVNSDGIKDQIIADFKKKGKEIEPDAFSIAKRLAKWDLVVQHTDPQLAAEAANAWLDISFNALLEARQHSLNALAISKKLSILTNCSNETDPSSFCTGITNNIQLSDEITALTNALDAEERSSRSVSVVLTFEKGGYAEIPIRPTIFNRNLLVLVGCILGLILGSMGVILEGIFLSDR